MVADRQPGPVGLQRVVLAANQHANIVRVVARRIEICVIADLGCLVGQDLVKDCELTKRLPGISILTDPWLKNAALRSSAHKERVDF